MHRTLRSRLLPALQLIALLIPGLAALPSFGADAAAGRIQALVGSAKLYDAAGKERDIRKGGDIQAGDRIVTSDQSLVQMRLSDGSYVSVRMNTDVVLVKYHHDENAPKESGIILSLARGALRSITGLIGSLNPDGYKVATPTATIGIRGTDHEPVFIPEPAAGETPIGTPGTYDKVNSGHTVLRAASGEITLAPGQVGFVPAAAVVPPAVLPKVPDFFRQLDPSRTRAAARAPGREPAKGSVRAAGPARLDQAGDGDKREQPGDDKPGSGATARNAQPPLPAGMDRGSADTGRGEDKPRSSDAAPNALQLAPVNLAPRDGGRGESDQARATDAAQATATSAEVDRNRNSGRDDPGANRRNAAAVENLPRSPAATVTDSTPPAAPMQSTAATAPTTTVPTTTVPTTAVPTTAVPTTAAATSVTPTTVAPLSASPTAAAPTTVSPATAAISPGRSSAVTLPATANPNAQKR